MIAKRLCRNKCERNEERKKELDSVQPIEKTVDCTLNERIAARTRRALYLCYVRVSRKREKNSRIHTRRPSMSMKVTAEGNVK